MVEIVVTNREATQAARCESVISLVDAEGHVLGRFARLEESSIFSADELAELEKRLDDSGPRRSMRELIDELSKRAP